MRLLSRLRLRGGGDPLVCQEFVELVTDHLEGALPAAERARFESHLAACDGCAAYFESFRATVSALGTTPHPPPDPHTRETLIRAFRDLRG